MTTVTIDELRSVPRGSRVRFEGGEGALIRTRRTRRGLTRVTLRDDDGRRFDVAGRDLELDVLDESEPFDGTNLASLADFVLRHTRLRLEVVGMWCDERECRTAVVMSDEPIVVMVGQVLTYDGVRLGVAQCATSAASVASRYRRR